MSIGKYLSLEEARKTDQLDRFIKEHPSKGNKELFNKLLNAAIKPEADPETSSPGTSESGNCLKNCRTVSVFIGISYVVADSTGDIFTCVKFIITNQYYSFQAATSEMVRYAG